MGRCDLHDHGHGHRLQTEIRERKDHNERLYETCLLCGWCVVCALFGSFGIKLLSSKDAKKAYVHVTAAGLRMKDSVMGTVTTVQENAADILASAKELNEDRAAKEAEEAAAANLESEEA